MNPLPILRGFREFMDALLGDLEPLGYTDLAPNHFFQRLRIFDEQWRHELKCRLPNAWET
jgi:hypothetical protein